MSSSSSLSPLSLPGKDPNDPNVGEEEKVEEDAVLPVFRPPFVSPWGWALLQAHFAANDYDPSFLEGHFKPSGYLESWLEWYEERAEERKKLAREVRRSATLASADEPEGGMLGKSSRASFAAESFYEDYPPPACPKIYAKLNNWVVLNQVSPLPPPPHTTLLPLSLTSCFTLSLSSFSCQSGVP